MSFTLRSGRLAAPRKDVVKFISSIKDDQRLARSTVLINEAHVIALAKAGIINPKNARKLLKALQELESHPLFREEVEDIHVLIEEYVTKQVGTEAGGMLNAGKSRNDQVATAIRMTVREALLELSGLIISFESELLRLAARHRKSLFVGYTHLQPAQPITLAHYLLAIGDALLRDNQRLKEAYARVNTCPMGAAALAGTSFDIDRSLVAGLLGFEGLVENSLDAVGSRDFVLDTLGVCSFLALDISRLAQDLIFYTSPDVGLIELPDEFTSTSSIMPQKKNPDPLEVIRARCARVVGNHSSASTTLHALTTGYNLDFQELSPLVWESMDIVNSCLKMLIQLVPRVSVRPRVRNRNHDLLTVATEIANLLVREEGVPFREAHHAVGHAVKVMIERGKELRDLEPEFWGNLFDRKIREETLQKMTEALDLRKHFELYKTRGSPNPLETRMMILSRNRQIAHAARDRVKSMAKLRRSILKLHGSAMKPFLVNQARSYGAAIPARKRR